jgi:hypothetical protein
MFPPWMLCFVMVVQRIDALVCGRCIRRFGKIFVSVEADCDADFGVALSRNFRHAWVGALDYSQDAAAAPHTHGLAQRDLRRHIKGEFDFTAFLQCGIGKEEDAARTEILGEAQTFGSAETFAQGDGKKERKSLTGAAFNPNWRSRHGGTVSEPPGKRTVTLAQVGPQEKLQVGN